MSAPSSLPFFLISFSLPDIYNRQVDHGHEPHPPGIYCPLWSAVDYSDKDGDNQFVGSFQNGPIPLHWLSNSGHIIWANDAELEILGYSKEEYLGHHMLEVPSLRPPLLFTSRVQFCPEETHKLAEVFSKLDNGEKIEDTVFKFQTKTGEAKFLLLDGNVMLDSEGSFRHICCFLRDVTKRHLNDRLLEIQRKSTQSLLELKDTFLKRVFYEMKTPLHTLLSHLKDYYSDVERFSLVSLDDNHSSYQVELIAAPRSVTDESNALVIDHQISKVFHLLENISSAQKYQEKHIFQVQPLSLHFPTVIRSLLFQAKEAELRPGHHLQFQMELAETMIRTDKMIQCVLYNLLANAIRYSPPDHRPHPILFKITSTHPTGPSSSSARHHFTLTNTFSPPLDLRDISQRFQTPQSLKTNGSRETIGLGLYVSSQIIQNLGGRLECHCYGSEITFQFTLTYESARNSQNQSLDTMWPCLEEAVTWIPLSPHEESNLSDISQLSQSHLETTNPDTRCDIPRNKRPRHTFESPVACPPKRKEVRAHTHLFLIVEDSTLCQKIVMKLLTSFGFRCEVANNGYEAIEKLKSPPCFVDVVLMDLRMPVMDGITAIKEIRKYPHLQGIPIIVTTAEVGPDIENEVYLAGGNHFLTKPVKRMELAKVLQKYLPLLTLTMGT